MPSITEEQKTKESTKQEVQTPSTAIPPAAGECVEDKMTEKGVRLRRYADGTEVVHFPDGSVETRTKEMNVRARVKRERSQQQQKLQKRVFATGDVKYQYNDGQTVTKFANGRLRVKNADGSVLVDSTPSSDNSSNSTNTHMTSP